MKITWPLFKKTRQRSHRVGLMYGPGWLQMVASSAAGDIIASEDIPCTNMTAVGAAFSAFCEQHQLGNPACSVILHASSYQMLLVEAPPVDELELAAALQWKIKDLLQTPIEDSVVDGFLLPDDAYRGRQKMAYAVATCRSDLQSLVDTLNDSGAEVDRVELPELVLLRLMTDYPREEQTEMVIVIGKQRGFLAVLADQAIYLSRTIDLGDELLAGGASAGQIDNFILEIQRSRDYFESQIGKGVVGRMLLAPLNSDVSVLVDAIADRLGTKVEVINSDCVNPQPLADAGAEVLLLASAAKAA